jgi:hypothetical protein
MPDNMNPFSFSGGKVKGIAIAPTVFLALLKSENMLSAFLTLALINSMSSGQKTRPGLWSDRMNSGFQVPVDPAFHDSCQITDFASSGQRLYDIKSRAIQTNYDYFSIHSFTSGNFLWINRRHTQTSPRCFNA